MGIAARHQLGFLPDILPEGFRGARCQVGLLQQRGPLVVDQQEDVCRGSLRRHWKNGDILQGVLVYRYAMLLLLLLSRMSRV